MRFRYVVVVAFVCSFITWAIAMAQVVAVKPVAPRVMTGADIGFRVTELRGNKPVGRLVVRVNDQWVEAEFAPAMTPLVGSAR